MKCVFCEDPIIKKRAIASNDLAWAFLSNIPIVPGHTLVAPIRHATSFGDLTTKEVEAVLGLRAEVATALREKFSAEGFNFAWNEGEIAGQSVPHFHLHVL